MTRPLTIFLAGLRILRHRGRDAGEEHTIGVILAAFLLGSSMPAAASCKWRPGSASIVQALQFIIVPALGPNSPSLGSAIAVARPPVRRQRKKIDDGDIRIMHAMDTDIAFSAIRISTPLIYAALGGLLTYQAGILNIALDGFMIVAAFAAIAVAYATASLTLGVLAGVLSATALAALLAVFNLRFKANIFIAGIAVTFMAYGLTALLLKGLLGQEGVFSSDRIPEFPPLRLALIEDIPAIGPLISGQDAAPSIRPISFNPRPRLLCRTPERRLGLEARVVGEAEDAVAAAGIGEMSMSPRRAPLLRRLLRACGRVFVARLRVPLRQADDQ